MDRVQHKSAAIYWLLLLSNVSDIVLNKENNKSIQTFQLSSYNLIDLKIVLFPIR